MLWTVVAMLNLSAGVALSLSPHRLTDLESMMRWTRQWLAGINVYDVANSYVDYPPNAIVVLSLLGLMPERLAAMAWTLLNICLAFVAPYFAARFLRPHDPFRVIALPILMFLSWGGIRTLTQFTLVALAASMAALVQADRRPVAAGLLLGVAMLKPHVALPVLLWTVFARRWRVLLASLGTVVAAVAVFCARVQETPIAIVNGYFRVLTVYHGATGNVLTGLSELRPLIWTLVGDRSSADTVAAGIAVALLASICWFGWREGRSRNDMIYAAPPFAAIWVLLTFRHLTYGFVILVPVLMLLALHDCGRAKALRYRTAQRSGEALRYQPGDASHGDGLRAVLMWTLQLAMMFDIPGLAMRFGAAGTTVYTNVLIHIDRMVFGALLVGFAVFANRELRLLGDSTGRLPLTGTTGPPLVR
jgi:hypothetical protein